MLSKEDILKEVRTLQYFYGLKKEIRYGETRTDVGESVAEHIYGMHVLALYFLAHEDPQHIWNRQRIYQMITWHDMDELETGDIIGYKKTPDDRKREETAMEAVSARVPAILQTEFHTIIEEYQEQKTAESRFVKALDKLEPLFQIYNENGKEILLRNRTTQEDSRKIKDAYVEPFPLMRAFNDVLNTTMEEEGFFFPSA